MLNKGLMTQTLSRGTRPMSIVRENLMTEVGYTPYCGDETCKARWPRTSFNGKQFQCSCGWTSGFEAKFIEEYKVKWNK